MFPFFSVTSDHFPAPTWRSYCSGQKTLSRVSFVSWQRRARVGGYSGLFLHSFWRRQPLVPDADILQDHVDKSPLTDSQWTCMARRKQTSCVKPPPWLGDECVSMAWNCQPWLVTMKVQQYYMQNMVPTTQESPEVKGERGMQGGSLGYGLSTWKTKTSFLEFTSKTTTHPILPFLITWVQEPGS